MARRRHIPEQIVCKLREVDWLVGEGADVAAVAGTWRSPSRRFTDGVTSSAG